MPPLDSATINAVLQKQGMPNTTENLNRIAQFAAMHPDLLQKYLGQGTDAAALAGAGTNGAIDNSIAAVEGRGQLAGPNPYSSTVDPNTGMSNIGPGLVQGPPEPTGAGPARRGNGPARAPGSGGQGWGGVEPPPGSMPNAANGQPPVNPLTLDSGNTINTPSMWEALALSLGPAGKLLVDRARLQVLQNQRGPYAPPPGMTPTPVGPQQPQGAAQQPQGTGRGAGAGGVNQPNTSRAGGSVPPSGGAATPNAPTGSGGGGVNAMGQRTGGSVPPTASMSEYGPVLPRTGSAATFSTTRPDMHPSDLDPVRPGPGQTPDDIARMRAEIAAENAGAQALQQQIGAQTKAKAPKPRVPGRP